MRVTDRERFDAPRFAVALLAALRATHDGSFQFRPGHFDRLATGPELRLALEAGRSAPEIWASWDADLARFREARKQYLIY